MNHHSKFYPLIQTLIVCAIASLMVCGLAACAAPSSINISNTPTVTMMDGNYIVSVTYVVTKLADTDVAQSNNGLFVKCTAQNTDNSQSSNTPYESDPSGPIEKSGQSATVTISIPGTATGQYTVACNLVGTLSLSNTQTITVGP